jgi:hypothetical protein
MIKLLEYSDGGIYDTIIVSREILSWFVQNVIDS